MSKSSTATTPKIPTPLLAKSAWSRGPPQTATAPTPRSQSPAPSTPTHQTHSRRPSTLGQGVPIKDGVSVPRSNVGAVKQGSAVTFGSIDDVSAPISSSPAAAPPTKSEGVKSFGSVPAASATGHVNGKASISSRTSVVPPAASSSSSAASTPPPSAAAVPQAKPKIDIKKMFQNPSSAPSSTPSSDSSSPSLRNAPLPSQPSSSHQGQSTHPQPSQLAHSFTPFVPSSQMRPPQNSGPNGGPPRSPQYSRQNANGPRAQGGQNGGPPAGLSSPRLGPHPHNGQPSPMAPPPMQPQMQPQMHQHMGMPWPGYYQPYPPDQQHYMYPGWYPPMPMQPNHAQHPPQPPHQHLPPHTGMPMSPRNPPSSLQGPGTPTPSHTHALPNPVHVQHPPPPALSHASNSIGGLTSPPPTPSSASIPRLNAGANGFVPRAKVTLKKEDGTEVHLENLSRSNPAPVPTSTATQSPQTSPYRHGSPSTPTRRPASIRIESEDQRKKRLAEEEQNEKEKAKLKAESDEKAKKEKEEAERKVKEAEEKKRLEEEAEKERIRKEEEAKKEQERIKLEEEERIRKEAEERAAQRIRDEEERIRKEAEEAEAKRLVEEKAKKEEEERLENERLAKEKAAEEERLAKEAEAERLRLEEETAAKKQETAPEPSVDTDGKLESTAEEGEVVEDGKSVVPPKEDIKDKKDALRINTGSPTLHRTRPGPLDLSSTKGANIAAPPPSALATARIISDISTIQYPEGVSSPRPELNEGAKEGKFRYDREFLLQFMSICKEKPAMLPPLDAIGLEPNDQIAMTRGGSGRHRQGSGPVPSRQGSIGLGFSPSTFAKGSTNPFSMGNFGTAGASKLSSEDRFAMSATAGRAASVSGAAGMQFNNRPTPVTRTVSQGGAGGAPLRERTRSKRGEGVRDPKKQTGGGGGGGGQQGGHGGGYNSYQQQQQMNLEPVAPLQATENRWDRKAIVVDSDSPEMVDRKVKGLLNKLTMEKFDSISDQIISWANKSEKEKDGRTLIQVIRLVFEKATDEATWSEMYARLCRKMMEQISPKVQDDGIKNNEGKPIAGGQLFRKYLLNRCQEDFERGWMAKETTAAAAASKATEDNAAAKAASEKPKEDGKEEEAALYSEEYYAAQKAKRQGLGLIKFIGELFKLQMLTERIMHECVKKLLGNVDNPEEEEIESLCKLLTTVGGILDTPKARAHLDVYFSRMKELTKSPNVSSRMQYMLIDLIELRDRKWVSRTAVAAPTTIAQIHENAAKEKAAAEKDSYNRQASMSRGGSRRGGDRGDFSQVGPDGWAVAGSGAPRPPPKAGDLSNFGKINKTQPMTFGPSSVFAGKKGADAKRESLSRTSSSSNMFSMLSSQAAETTDAAAKVSEPTQRKRLVLQPRSKPVESETAEPPADGADGSEAGGSEVGGSEPEATVEMTEADAKKKIAEDSKEFFAVRNLDEAEVYFSALPPSHHHLLVDTLVLKAVESKEADAQLVADFFARTVKTKGCDAAAFEAGMMNTAEIIDDIAIDAPKALQLFATMIKGADLDETRRTNLASKSMDSEKLLGLITS